MKLHLKNKHKYYNIQTQLTLFGTENLICTWGSVNNRGNHKIVNCNTSTEKIHNLKRIIKTRKNRGYNIAPTVNSKAETCNTTTINNIEQLISLLDNPEQFKIVQRYQKPGFYKVDDSVPKQTGVFLDTETTGLSCSTDKILELGMAKFEYCENGYVYKILDEFNQYQDPEEPIAFHITELTGITDEMVKGRNIDKAEVSGFLEDVDIIIAHNAQFDRPFFDKMFPGIKKAWGCSRADINWKAEKIESQKLEYLAYKYNFFYEGHRAVNDCLAGLHLLAQILPVSKEPVLKKLLTNCHKARYRIWAQNAPYATKDLLRAKGYRWSTHPRENYKAWMIEVDEDNLESELDYLRSDIYLTNCTIPTQHINAYNRFK